MKFAQIADRRVERQLAKALDLAEDPDISAVAEEDAMRKERAEIDRLIDEVDRELAREESAESVRLRLGGTKRRIVRSRRRAERQVVRSLPVRLDADAAVDVEAEVA